MKPMQTRTNKRTSKATTLVALWVPTHLLKEVDARAEAEDLDRSKLIRKYIRQAVSRSA